MRRNTHPANFPHKVPQKSADVPAGAFKEVGNDKTYGRGAEFWLQELDLLIAYYLAFNVST